jgi:ABC-2 type transport system permease protein
MAGMNGAAPGSKLGGKGMLPSSRGVFSPLARAQYSALIHLRWRIFVNSLRSKMGAFEFGARTLSFLVYALMGIGLAFGSGGIAYGLAADKQWDYMPLVFWFVLFTWQIVPIMLASFQEQFNLGTLLRFPVGFSSFYLLYVVFGLSDVSTAIGALCCVGILTGITVVRPDLFAFTVLVLIVFAAFNILLVRAIFSWIDRWLSQRRTREILAGLFMIFFLSFQLANPAVWQHGRRSTSGPHQSKHDVEEILDSRWARGANSAQEWLPPGLAGMALRDAAVQRPVRGLGLLAVLGLYAIAAGAALAMRLKAEFSGEDLSVAPARRAAPLASDKPAAQRVQGQENTWQFGGAASGSPSIIASIIQKEFQSLFRALPLLYAIGAPLLMVLVISGGFLRGGLRTHAPVFAFPLCVFFAQLGFHQLWGNNLGTEGPGVQLYFLSPTPFRTVMLAKNIFHTAIFVLAMVIAGLLATVRLGAPDSAMLATTVAWLLFVLLANLAVGNVFSLTMAYKINPGRLSRQRRSQGAAFLSLLVQLGLVGVGAIVYEFCSVVHMPLLAVPIFLVLGGVAAFLWFRILGNADNIANQRKDQLIAVLTKADD